MAMMFERSLALDLWGGAAIVICLYLLKWRLHPLYHIPTVGGSSLPLLSYIGARRFASNGKEMIQEGYRKHYGKAFRVPTMDRWMVFVSGPAMLDDIKQKPDNQLSLSKSFADSTQLHRMVDPSVVSDRNHVAMIKNQLTRALPVLMPHAVDELRQAVPEYIPADSEEWVDVNVLDALRQIVVRTSGRVFVGYPLCRNREYLDLALQFTSDLLKDRDMLSWWPSFLKPYISMGCSMASRSLRRNCELLRPVIDERLDMASECGDDWTDKPNDLLQWFVEAEQPSTRYKAIADRIMLTNFAAIHSTSLTGSIAMLCLAERPECIAPIREEIETVIAEEGYSKAAMAKCWKLDSLLKESLRCQGTGLGTLARKVVGDVTLLDGTFLPRGTELLAAAYSIHHDDATYEDPHVFDPFRFSRMREGSKTERANAQFVHPSPDYLSFGYGRHACPGRFFAENELKALLAYIIVNYDFKRSSDGPMGAPVYHGRYSAPPVNATLMFKKRKSKV